MELTEHAYIFYYGIPIVLLLILSTITLKNNGRARENQLLAGSFIVYTILFGVEWYRHLAPLTVSPFMTNWVIGIGTMLSLSMLMHVCVKLCEKHTKRRIGVPIWLLYSGIGVQVLILFTPIAPTLADFSRSGIWIERDAPIYFAWIVSFVILSLSINFAICLYAYVKTKGKKASRHLFMFLMTMLPFIIVLYIVCVLFVPATYMPSISTIYMVVFLAMFLMIGMQRYNLFPQYARRYATMFERSPICKFMLNERFEIQEANEQTVKYLGAAFAKTNFVELMERSGNMAHVQRLLDIVDEKDEVANEIVALNNIHTGNIMYLVVNAIKIQDDGEVFYYVMFRDKTIERQQQERIRELAFYDGLTKLPNRTAFMAQAEEAFMHRDGSGIVLFDLNFFKRINDEHGHAAGDAVLRATADVLKEFVTAPNIPARLGGDEFVIYIDESTLDMQVSDYVEELRYALETKKLHFEGHALRISPSIGYCSKTEAATFDEALQEADKRMYDDKARIKQQSIVKGSMR